jgi:addiction module HigA family antidote
MAMKNPAHPGALIRDNLNELGLTVAEAAVALGTTRQQLHRVITGKSDLSPEMAIRLEKGIGGGADMWLRMQANFDAAEVRKRAGDIHVVRLTPKVV